MAAHAAPPSPPSPPAQPSPIHSCFSGRLLWGVYILECSLFQPPVWVPLLGHRTHVNHFLSLESHGPRASEAPAETEEWSQPGKVTSRRCPLSRCLFIPTLSTVMGASTEYSVSGGIGTGRCCRGSAGRPSLSPGSASPGGLDCSFPPGVSRARASLLGLCV